MGVTPEGRRTQALRGPGAGGFTPAHSLAASNPCLNCGTNVQLEYCPECGQRQTDADPTLREFLHELAEEFLHWDGKLFTTFRTLVSRPGILTTEYLAGRRVRYISPLRLYLSCSVLFFFLDAVIPTRAVPGGAAGAAQSGVVQVNKLSDADIAELDSTARAAAPIARVWLTHMARALRTPGELQHATMAAMPKAMFLLVPLFAALMGVVYRDRRRKYPQHLAFALHVHAALFLTLTARLVARAFPPAAGAVVALLLLVPFVVYLARATTTVYQGSAAQAIGRLMLACSMYFVAFIATIATVFAVIVLSF